MVQQLLCCSSDQPCQPGIGRERRHVAVFLVVHVTGRRAGVPAVRGVDGGGAAVRRSPRLQRPAAAFTSCRAGVAVSVWVGAAMFMACFRCHDGMMDRISFAVRLVNSREKKRRFFFFLPMFPLDELLYTSFFFFADVPSWFRFKIVGAKLLQNLVVASFCSAGCG